MAAKRDKKRSQPSARHGSKSPKVGSDRAADREVGGKLDFGFPAAKTIAPLPDGGREKGPDQGTGPMRSGEDGNRVYGVAHPPGPVGTGSGGDLDPDLIGLDGKGGVANSVDERRTAGPDITEGGSSAFASGPPAQPNNSKRSGSRGSPEVVRGSTVDRSGGDASTTGMTTGDEAGRQ